MNKINESDALECAFYMVDYAYKNGIEYQLSGIKMNQLLYIAQGIHLGLYNKPMFEDKIEKCGLGIQIESITKEFIRYGGLTIPSNFMDFNNYFYGIGIDVPNYKKHIVNEKSHNLFTYFYYRNDNLPQEKTEILKGIVLELSKFSTTSFTRKFVFESLAYEMMCEKKSNFIDCNDLQREYENRLKQGEKE